ncbi:MAG: tetratricopeptide repeat protein [Chloroflexi bacterium]|nr:tetratricopeptide repeat protein [Chloroflexota bacterium]
MACTLLRSPQLRLLTFTGTAGVGKTSLALHVATELLDVFGDTVCFVPLAAISDAQFVVSTIAHSLGLTEHGNQPLLDVLKTALQKKHVLLLLDNFEQVINAAPLLSDLLDACPTLKLLVTSREVLRLRGEQSLMVSPLALPDLQHLPGTEDLARYAAIDLFLQRVYAFKPAFQLTERNASVIAEICIRLDGLPLALELAAARLKVLSPQALLAGLQHRLDLLTTGARDQPERHQTLRKTIQWSYDLLSEQEQQLFRRLSIFAGGCTFEALVALSEALGDGRDQVLDTVTALIDKSLVQQVEPAEGEPRLTLLETLREYGLECLTRSGERAIIRQAHAFYYLTLAQEAKPKFIGATETLWLDRLERERENLRAAMHWSLEQGESGQSMEMALQLGHALEQFWMTRGPYSEGRTFLEKALAASEGVALSVRAHALIAAANFVSMQGDYDQGEVLAQESLQFCQHLGDKPGIARSLYQLGRAVSMKGNLRAARSYMEKSVEIRREIGDKRFMAIALRHLGEVIACQGEYVRACALCEESVQFLREPAFEEALALSLFSLAWTIFVSQGDLAVVQSKIEEGLALARELDSKEGMANFLSLSGWVTLNQGDAVRARMLLEESMILYRQVGAKQGIAMSLSLLGKIVASQRDYTAACAFYQESLTLYREMGDKQNMPSCLEGLASVVAAQETLVWAARLWGTAEALREAVGRPLPPVDRALYDASVAAARTRLGEKAFTSAWDEGRTMTPEQAHTAREAIISPTPLLPATSLPVKSSRYPAGLTRRELEVLHLLAQGLTDAQIADKLTISTHTVRIHVNAIFRKVDVNTRAAAARYAFDHHLL